jgi:hypothetical protein
MWQVLKGWAVKKLQIYIKSFLKKYKKMKKTGPLYIIGDKNG